MLLAALAVVFGLSAVTPWLTRALGRDAGYVGAATLAGLTAWLGAAGPGILDGRPVVAELDWLPSADLALALRMDSLAWMFALIVLGIGALVLAYSARYFGRDDSRASRYLALLAFFAGSMLGLVLADDVVLLFVFWELTSVSSFFLIGGLGEGREGATRAFLTTSIGGLALFAAVILMSVVAGSSSISEIVRQADTITASGTAPAVIVLLLLAAATKSAQLPFQYWLPGAMVAPTPVSTYLHAATMVKAGIYLLFRFTPVFAGDLRWQVPVVLLGLATAVFGAVLALKRSDLKALLAYSTVSQLGLLVGLIGIGTPLALAAAALHTVAHSLFKATLFMVAGIVDHETGTRDLHALGGLRKTLPLPALAAGLAALSMAGLPPLLGFVSKEEALAGFVKLAEPAWIGPFAATLAVLASIGTFAYSARFYIGTFEGPVRTPAHAAPHGFTAPAVLTALAGLVFGLVVPWFDPLVNAVGRDAAGASPDLHLALWHGFTVPLALSAVIVGGGLLLVFGRSAVERFQQQLTAPTGDGAFDRLYDGTLALGSMVGRRASSHSPAEFLVPVLAVIAAAGIAALAVTDLGSLGPPAPWLGIDWAVVVLLGGGIIGVLQARSRLAAIAALGLTGFTVAGWFVLLGAPDLALTQLLVETLTVTLIVLVFRRLPPEFARGGRPRRAGAATLAVVIGALAGGGTYLLTGRREFSEVAGRFLAEGEQLTGGTNVVNTILVDFRALDTLGEITVVAVAAAAIVAVIRLAERHAVPGPDAVADHTEDGQPLDHHRFAGIGMIDSMILARATDLLAPIMVAVSIWLLLRGHDAVGGGFIGGLTAGAAVVLLYLSRGHQRIWQNRRLRTLPLVASGLLIAGGYGVAGYLYADAYLGGTKVSLPFGLEVAASLVFDIGVYLVVIGIVVSILRHLGQGVPEPPPDPTRISSEPHLVDARGEDRS